MAFLELLGMILTDANTRWVVAATALLGMASGVIGCFALLRKHSLMGDVMAHAALPGICIAFLLYGNKSIGIFLLGAAVSGLAAAYVIHLITSYSPIKEDSALGLVLSVFFGFGIVLLTQIQHHAGGNQTGLDDFLFGQAAAMVGNDVKVMMGVTSILFIAVFALFKEFKLLCFDPQFGEGLGFPMRRIHFLLMGLIVGAVVIGLQAVGVVLMSAMLMTPGIAARYWTDRLDRMVWIAGFFGALSGAVGSLASALAVRMPTGPLIVLSATALFIISLLFAPKRGLAAKGVRLWKMRSVVLEHNVLQSLYELTVKEISDPAPGERTVLTAGDIAKRKYQKPERVEKMLHRLERRGWVRKHASASGDQRFWALTEAGRAEAHRRSMKEFHPEEQLAVSFKSSRHTAPFDPAESKGRG